MGKRSSIARIAAQANTKQRLKLASLAEQKARAKELDRARKLHENKIRTLVRLHYLENKTKQEVADELGITTRALHKVETGYPELVDEEIARALVEHTRMRALHEMAIQRKLLQLSHKATNTLESLFDDPAASETVKARASKDVLSMVIPTPGKEAGRPSHNSRVALPPNVADLGDTMALVEQLNVQVNNYGDENGQEKHEELWHAGYEELGQLEPEGPGLRQEERLRCEAEGLERVQQREEVTEAEVVETS